MVNGGVRAAAQEVVEQGTSVARVASLELKRKTTALGIGIGFGAGAAVVAVFAVGFALATVTAALATFLATWLALLIVTLALALVAVGLGLLARGRFAKATPPVPEQAIRGVERERLAAAVENLRAEVGALSGKAKVAAIGGFALSGGVRATKHYLARRRARR